VQIGVNANIYDTDFHTINATDRRLDRNTPNASVWIEDDVWIGTNVTVLKGVAVGKCAVIAAGSVMVANVAADTLAGVGCPRRFIRTLDGDINRRAVR